MKSNEKNIRGCLRINDKNILCKNALDLGLAVIKDT